MSENDKKTVVETAETVDVVEVKKAAESKKVEKTDKKKKEKKERKRPLKEMVSELKKVSWPSKADLRTYAVCVLVFVVVCSILLFLMDIGASALTKYISSPDGLPKVLNGWFGIGG